MKLAPNPFTHTLAVGNKQVGLWICLCRNFVAEVTAHAGYDWALIKPAAQKLIAKGMPAGIVVLGPACASELLNKGFSFVAFGTDASLLAKASDGLLVQVKGGLT